MGEIVKGVMIIPIKLLSLVILGAILGLGFIVVGLIIPFVLPFIEIHAAIKEKRDINFAWDIR